MKVFSFRAECPKDVHDFLDACKPEYGVLTTIFKEHPTEPSLPDRYIEITTTATLEELYEVFRTFEDSYVMLQTLKQCSLKFNDLKRNYNLQ